MQVPQTPKNDKQEMKQRKRIRIARWLKKNECADDDDASEACARDA